MLLFLLILFTVLGIGIACLIPGHTSPIKDDDGKILPGSISSLEKVKLGGAEQWILIRSENPGNPVLLFLHGGPGTAEMALLEKYNMPELQKYYTVVAWDQRGAGKSYAAINPESKMTIEQFVSDAQELTRLLCRRFNQEKIFLAGHSWGSALGLLTVQKYPELYHAYIGIGQVVNMVENERISYEWVLRQAVKANDSKSIAKLKKLGTPPYTGDWKAKTIAERRVLAKYGGEVYNNPRGGMQVVLGSLLRSKEYRWADKINFLRGVLDSMRLLWPQIMKINFIEQAAELKVPVYFLEGRHDYEVPSQLVEQYCELLKAPVKEIIWFENSAHFPNTEEVKKFNDFFIEKLRL